MEQGVFYNKIRVAVHLDRIRDNWLAMHAAGGNAAAVIKSDAYGHGLEPVARVLVQAGARTLAVGTVEEAVRLRRAAPEARILCLLGAQDPDEFEAACVHGLVPAVFDRGQLDALAAAAARRGTAAEAALKFDTGMARLGFRAKDVADLAGRLKDDPHVRAVVVMSHLATADDPGDQGFVLEQGREFGDIVSRLREAGLVFDASLANSAGLLGYPALRHDVQRPGIALYGCNPFHGTAWEDKGRGLVTPAMDVSAPVLQVHDLPKGRSISYGRTYVAPRDQRVAVVAAGYADCWSRGLSSRDGQGACVVVRGRRAPVLGRVCMQMTAVDVTHIPDAAAGDAAWLLGGPDPCAVTPEDLAGWWRTITYEVFCLLGMNRRTYLQA